MWFLVLLTCSSTEYTHKLQCEAHALAQAYEFQGECAGDGVQLVHRLHKFEGYECVRIAKSDGGR